MSIGVKAGITHCNLARVRDVRGDPGNELQIVHYLLLRDVLPRPITKLALRL
jgi:hypothetical protein